MTHGANEAANSRKVIHASCSLHGGPAVFANVVLRKVDGGIELDPHVTGSCVLRFAEYEAAALAETITEWLG
ncbi:MAG: hypothetical protein ACRDTH_13745 [Pseudonocardiaceae bacterium]